MENIDYKSEYIQATILSVFFTILVVILGSAFLYLFDAFIQGIIAYICISLAKYFFKKARDYRNMARIFKAHVKRENERCNTLSE